MSANAYVAAYERYCECQTIEGYAEPPIVQVRRLMSAIAANYSNDLREFESVNDQLYAIWKTHVGRAISKDFREFRTSGSTHNAARFYRSGPYPELWIRALWSYSRHPLGFRELILLEPYHDQFPPVTLTHTPEGQYPYCIRCGPLTVAILEEVIAIFRRLLDEHPACTLIAVPDTLLYLNDQPLFQEFVIEHRDRFSLASQHWEPFFKRRHLHAQGVHINDVMTDWTTGFNFYTCRVGHLHTFQTFAMGEGRRVSLLNLMGAGPNVASSDEDSVVPRRIVPCGCGKNRLEFDFIPHPANLIRSADEQVVYDPDLAELLTSHLRGIQFLQENKTIVVVYRPDGKFRDGDLIEEYFGQRGFRVNWKPNDLYPVGPKRPVFFRFPCS